MPPLPSKLYPDIASIITQTKPARPVLCFNPEKIAQNVRAFQSGFHGTVAWAVKSNPDPMIIKAIVAAGIRQFDVASADEIDRIRKYCPEGIMHFNHPIKPIEEIKYAYFKCGIRRFVIDDIAELEKIIQVLDKGKVSDVSDICLLIRYRNPDKGGSANYDFGKKFGASPENAAFLLKTAIDKGFKVGLTFHPGSQNENLDIYPNMIKRGQDIAKNALGADAKNLVRFNIGGGFPCYYLDRPIPPLPDYFNVIHQASQSLSAELFCEPGRALVANSIHVLTRINLRRHDDNRIYINDGFYGSFMELPFVDFFPPYRVYDKNGQLKSMQHETALFEIWGPTCDSLDKLPKPIPLPVDIATGDYIEFGLMGAYTNATTTDFNGIDRARWSLVDHLTDWKQ